MVSSHFPLMFHSRRLPGGVFLRVRHRRVAPPRALLPRFHPRPQPLAIARSVALDDVIELVPVNGTEIVMAALGIPLELGVGHANGEIIRRGRALCYPRR